MYAKNPCTVGYRDVKKLELLFNRSDLCSLRVFAISRLVLKNTLPAVIESSGTSYLLQMYYLTSTQFEGALLAAHRQSVEGLGFCGGLLFLW